MKRMWKKLLPLATVATTATCFTPLAGCAQTNNAVGVIVTIKPNKLTYGQGQALDLTGMQVKVVKSDNTKEVTTKYKTSIQNGTKLQEKGTIAVTVTLDDTNFKDTFDITVTDPVVEKLEIVTPPTNLVFYQNDNLTLDGLKLKATKSNGEVIEDYKHYITEPKVGTKLTQWGKNTITIYADQASITIDVLVITDPIKFSEASWEMIADWAYFVELGLISTDEFKSHFLKDDDTEYASINEFIGLEKTIEINGKTHRVKIIDVQHDTIVSDIVPDNAKALFTFQLFNKVSDDKGTYLDTLWNNEKVLDYTNSQLRYNLDKKGDESRKIKWGENHSTETRSLFEMLPAEFNEYIWPVKKTVYGKIEGGTSFEKLDYVDRLFLLTPTELAQSDDKLFYIEGSSYKWWVDHNNVSDRKMKDISGSEKGEGISYFTPSPSKSSKTNIICVKDKEYQGDKGFGTFDPVAAPQAIVPCFCI